jgi:threonine dehydratase
VRLVRLADIEKAAAGLPAEILHTPLLAAAWADRPLWIKAESLQPIGAFKLRGAMHAMGQLDAGALRRGVVTHSSGNHAQAVAYAARAAGVKASIVMPADAPRVKLEAVRRLGAEVVLVEAAQRATTAARITEELGATLIPPYDDPAIVAGQGSVGLEIVEDLPDVEVVLVPVSGGGLLSGVAAAVKALRPAAAVIGCEPELAGDLAEGFAAGRRVEWSAAQTGRTIADGLRVPAVGQLNWAHIHELVDDVVTVSEPAIRAAMRVLALGSRLVAEPSGAVSTAAVLERAGDLPPGRTVAILSGGNVDPALLAEVLAG